MNSVELKPGRIIRYKYRCEWEYAVWHGDLRTILCSQGHLNYYRTGGNIMTYGDDPKFRAEMHAYKTALRDPREFLDFFCKANKCEWFTKINRIEFKEVK